MTSIKSLPNHLKVENQKLKVVKEFKYLGEWISWNSLRKKAMEARRNEVEVAFQCHQKHKQQKSTLMELKNKRLTW